MAVTVATYLLINHEIAHAVLGHMVGLDVVYCKRDARDGGETCAVYRDDDTRSLAELAFTRTVFLIGAVDHEPGLADGEQLFRADKDVMKAFALADKAGFSVESASAYGRDLRVSDAYRERHARGVDALMRKTYLDRRDLARMLK